MTSWARPGVKCVCVDDNWYGPDFRDAPSRLPMINEVLTVKEAFPEEVWRNHGLIAGGVGLSFEELGHDWFFAVAHFRPLVTKTQQQDIELFRHLLDTTKLPERV